MNKNPDFSIVFPVMNQADHIEKVIRSYHKELTKNKFSFELIAVVNCTKDNSFEICKTVSTEFPNVSVYNLAGCGYGLGILYGLKKAKGRYLCYVSCARVWSDELVLCLKYFLIDTKVIIHAVRRRRDTLMRNLSSIIYNGTCRAIFDIYFTDINGTPKIFSREIYHKLDLFSENSMIDLEFIEKTKKRGYRTIQIPIYNNERHGGKSTSNFTTIFRLIKEIAVYWVKTRLLVKH